MLGALTYRITPKVAPEVERSRTIKEATVKRYYYQSHGRLKQHLHTFLTASNVAKRLNPVRGGAKVGHKAVARSGVKPDYFRG
jgi:hypothetical protein